MIWDDTIFQIALLFDVIMLGACLSVYLIETISNRKQ